MSAAAEPPRPLRHAGSDAVSAIGRPPHRLELEFERTSDPIAGRLHRQGERPQPFEGYVQLVVAVQAALRPGREAEREEVEGTQ